MDKDTVLKHIAFIMDGNGRWAKSKGMPRNYGHVQGAKTVEAICEEAYRMGIQYLTVYAFSTENWDRPADEVDALMGLLRNYMKSCHQFQVDWKQEIFLLQEEVLLETLILCLITPLFIQRCRFIMDKKSRKV